MRTGIHCLHGSSFSLNPLLFGELLTFPLFALQLRLLALVFFVLSVPLKLSQPVLLLLQFFLASLLGKDLALVRRLMISPVLLLNEVLAIFAFGRLGAARLDVINPDLYAELLLAVLALFGPHVAILLVRAELGGWRCERAVLTLDWLVGLLFVLFAVSLGHDFATLTALVVVASAADLVHPNLGDFNGSFAGRAHFSFFFHSQSKLISN